MIPDTSSPVYDLFCDHGKVGEAFLGKRPVYFNDVKETLLLEIQKKLDCSKESLLFGPAQDLRFEPFSHVIMLGVGGLLMADCFESWSKSSLQNFNSDQVFIVSSHFNQVELSETLRKLKALCLDRKFVWDKGRGYEVFKFTFCYEVKDYRPFEIFDRSFWHDQIFSNSMALPYLKGRLRFTESNQTPTIALELYRDELREFLKNK
ncbi:MAG: hypothetical protein NXH75_06035 [Halobacteriovoraceae bacterium]|nr:hypothetical protein [Halobacteriovoraceae bacterium]